MGVLFSGLSEALNSVSNAGSTVPPQQRGADMNRTSKRTKGMLAAAGMVFGIAVAGGAAERAVHRQCELRGGDGVRVGDVRVTENLHTLGIVMRENRLHEVGDGVGAEISRHEADTQRRMVRGGDRRSGQS